MKSFIVLISILLTFMCCQPKVTSPKRHVTVSKNNPIKPSISKPNHSYDIENHLRNYEQLVFDIQKDKNYYKRQNDLDRVKKVTFKLLNDSIFPYWYGTPWSYNGISEKPLHDSVACGYFVTTTLRDVGFPVKRFYWAQQPSSVLIYSLCNPSSIQSFSTLKDLKNYLKNQPNENLYLLGLDTHVGYVTKENNTLFFTHSSYSGEQMVKKDLLENAQPILKSKSFLIGNLLDNKTLLKKWLND